MQIPEYKMLTHLVLHFLGGLVADDVDVGIGGGGGVHYCVLFYSIAKQRFGIGIPTGPHHHHPIVHRASELENEAAHLSWGWVYVHSVRIATYLLYMYIRYVRRQLELTMTKQEARSHQDLR